MNRNVVRAIALISLILSAEGCQMGVVLGLIPPETPKGLAASTAGGGSLSVSWIRSSGATSYQVYRDTSPAGAFSTLAYSGTDSSFTDGELSAGTVYWYKVRASSAAGSSDLTASASASTPMPDPLETED
jgi:hypothetical protein